MRRRCVKPATPPTTRGELIRLSFPSATGARFARSARGTARAIWSATSRAAVREADACGDCADHRQHTDLRRDVDSGRVFQCRACVDDADCVTALGLEQCFTGQCAACDPNNHAGCSDATPLCTKSGNNLYACAPCTDQFCLEESPDAPVCMTGGTSSGKCVVCDATHTEECPEATPLRDAATNTCVECNAHSDCDDPTKLLCSPTTHACVACTNSAVSAGADAACDAKVDGTRWVESGALAGRCGACDPFDDGGCVAGAPQCQESTATCVGVSTAPIAPG